MNTQLVMTVIGPDRPGLVSALSNAIAAGAGNWLDSRMASLAGQFAGILLLEVPSARVADMRKALQQLESMGLRIVVEQSAVEAAAADGARVLKLELIGHDRPGIVRDISRVLADQQVVHERETTFATRRSGCRRCSPRPSCARFPSWSRPRPGC